MAFNDDQKAAVVAAVSKYLNACPVCKEGPFTLSPHLTLLPNLDDKSISLGTGQACLVANCRKCGYVMLFNVVAMGLAEKLGVKPATDSKDG